MVLSQVKPNHYTTLAVQTRFGDMSSLRYADHNQTAITQFRYTISATRDRRRLYLKTHKMNTLPGMGPCC
ncbi:hypothetical protein INT44_001591 [Umbelopsis vinacea]|uniref:Uncharacterized protein n=1 Tax=Umbelopsis vinacea TaxID=44442 RepID=A0A8H7PQ80_9FUNG|nr:hypothetical protein INT44_001591 [Umbelopsis vinacea]